MIRSAMKLWRKSMMIGALCLAPGVAISQSAASAQACHGADFTPGDDLPFIIFSSHSYPAVDRKMSQDFDVDRLADLAAIGKFAGLAVNDMFVPLLMLPCSHEVYDATACRPNFLFGAAAAAEDVNLTGERLSFTLIDEDAGVVNQVIIGNRSYDSLSLTSEKGGATTVSSWNRASDGTETYEGSSGDGNIVRYTERPDCSGEGYIAEAENGAVTHTADFSWTSTKADDFVLTYELCSYVDGKDCESGAF